ncbi:hypothetical protein VTN49DRAFT_2661 [Thermomyces lanuginosus]|uniref:uncharacterized protein n=1 Tax=Thermomyces lanuginosus TaxID=5541 RepID=UPI0037446A3D
MDLMFIAMIAAEDHYIRDITFIFSLTVLLWVRKFLRCPAFDSLEFRDCCCFDSCMHPYEAAAWSVAVFV